MFKRSASNDCVLGLPGVQGLGLLGLGLLGLGLLVGLLGLGLLGIGAKLVNMSSVQSYIQHNQYNCYAHNSHGCYF